MAVNLKSVQNAFSKINSKGASLVRNEKGISISNAIQEGLQIPEGAKSFDAVRVGRNFNPNKHYTDVFTFRGEKGEIVGRYTKKVDGKNVSETKKWFTDLYPWERDLDEFGNDVLNIPARKVRAFTRENGKLTSVSEDVFAVTDETKPCLTHFKRMISRGDDAIYRRKNYEDILLEERRNGEAAKFIKNRYEVDTYATGFSSLLKSDVSSPELNEIAKNTYFLPYVSPKNKFVTRMAQACIDDANFIVSPRVNLFKSKSKTGGFYNNYDSININLKNSRDMNRPREALTETIAHEVGHAKWAEKCSLYDWYKAGFDDGEFLRRCSKSEIPEIKRYQRSIDNYISPEVDYKGYYGQFCEEVARKEGRKGAKRYFDIKEKIENNFPNMHGAQFYPPSWDDDMEGLSTFFRVLIS